LFEKLTDAGYQKVVDAAFEMSSRLIIGNVSADVVVETHDPKYRNIQKRDRPVSGPGRPR